MINRYFEVLEIHLLGDFRGTKISIRGNSTNNLQTGIWHVKEFAHTIFDAKSDRLSMLFMSGLRNTDGYLVQRILIRC